MTVGMFVDKLDAFRRGAWEAPPTGCETDDWTESDWICWIDHAGRWLRR